MSYSDDLSAILKQGEKKFKKNESNGLSGQEKLKHMFNPFVDKAKESSATFRIRILPNAEGGSPFKEVEHHVLKVGKRYEKIVCPSNFGQDCPICETEEVLRSSEDPDQKKQSKDYRKRTFYVVRIVERGKEHDGVKFWRFPKNYEGKGNFDKIYSKIQLGLDVLSPDANGFDLIIACSLNEKKQSVINDIVTINPTPLADSQEAVDKLINDPLKWEEVFTLKDNQYLEDVIEGKAQYWDDTLKKYVRPGEDEVGETHILTPEQINFDEKPSKPVASTNEATFTPTETVDVKTDLIDSSIDEDDLPF